MSGPPPVNVLPIFIGCGAILASCLIVFCCIVILAPFKGNKDNQEAHKDIIPTEASAHQEKKPKETHPVIIEPVKPELSPRKSALPESPKIVPVSEKPVEPAKPKSKWIANASMNGTKEQPLVIAKFGFKIAEYRDAAVFNPTKAKKMIADREIALVVDTIAVAVESRAKGFTYFRLTEGAHEGDLFVAYDKDVIASK